MLQFRSLTSEGPVEGTAESPDELSAYTLARPIDPPEVWCAGVTYQRSRDARVEESVGEDVYTLVHHDHPPRRRGAWRRRRCGAPASPPSAAATRASRRAW